MRRATAAGAALLLLAGALSGCAPSGQQLDAGSARQLQASVLAVTTAAAAGDYSEAIAALDTLEEQLTEGTASGAIDSGRSARIQASIDLVRADLAAAEPQPSPTPDKPGKTDPGPKKGPPGKDKP
ncbi:hypothetical protein BKA04_000928 [Cryobacterium mesophilum]|uniref:Uncharacterized protein n=1 Tax=Terrimesophilobacter mesophilus TaxID=433647 RepID=A0A4V3I9H6_9MICO|nr:hypothetical protein [Terrimesophilobacter mesophilus]MBB5632705.1 hypothetical protein [Terrimesophilobacter mesophilus]TFB79508.1 hypothetical protein E3N84_05250 [Terrimesophilobacter mesophilus]